jgi:hypothetical protein
VPPSDNPEYIAAVREMREDWIVDLQREVADMIAAAATPTNRPNEKRAPPGRPFQSLSRGVSGR